MATITFIGLGNMGGPMASNLLKAGHDLTVFDLSESAVRALMDEGAKTRSTILEAVENAEVVISMLPAGQHVETVYLGEHGLLAHLPAATLVIDSSTIAPETSRAVADAAR
jgi:3-hydroxyisobutyrate dehydrogenase